MHFVVIVLTGKNFFTESNLSNDCLLIIHVGLTMKFIKNILSLVVQWYEYILMIDRDFNVYKVLSQSCIISLIWYADHLSVYTDIQFIGCIKSSLDSKYSCECAFAFALDHIIAWRRPDTPEYWQCFKCNYGFHSLSSIRIKYLDSSTVYLRWIHISNIT